MLSVLWVVCLSMWFFQHVPEVNGPGIASVYLQCIGQCPARAEWFRDEARSEFRADWPWMALGPILVIWGLVYIGVVAGRWFRRGFRPRA